MRSSDTDLLFLLSSASNSQNAARFFLVAVYDCQHDCRSSSNTVSKIKIVCIEIFLLRSSPPDHVLPIIASLKTFFPIKRPHCGHSHLNLVGFPTQRVFSACRTFCGEPMACHRRCHQPKIHALLLKFTMMIIQSWFLIPRASTIQNLRRTCSTGPVPQASQSQPV